MKGNISNQSYFIVISKRRLLTQSSWQFQIYVRMQFLEFTGSTLKKSLQLQLYPPSKFLHLCIQSLTGTHSFISKSREIDVIINDLAVSSREDRVAAVRTTSKPFIPCHRFSRCGERGYTRVKKSKEIL